MEKDRTREIKNKNFGKTSHHTHIISDEKLFGKLGKTETDIIQNFDSILQNISHLSSKQIFALSQNINELSHELTDERGNRRNGYMNETAKLSAYTHYFMWWNIFRMTNLFAGLPQNAFSDLHDGDYCLDLGSGPLTLVISLYLARPELRKVKLNWYCMDISQKSMSLGEEIFLSICAKLADTTTDDLGQNGTRPSSRLDAVEQNATEPWKIIRVKGEFGEKINKKVKFLTCANMFNELYYDTKMTLEEAAKKYTNAILPYTDENAKILIIEPAFPRSARFISLTRDALLRKKFQIIAPCIHAETCPMDGRKGGKWCHFVLDAEDAPKKLKALSQKSSLPKDRASLSFVFASNNAAIAQNATKLEDETIELRAASDSITLPGNRIGKYCCSAKGLMLLATNEKEAEKNGFSKIENGDKIKIAILKNKTPQIDRKSGATVIEL